MTGVTARDCYVPTPRGRLFARRWAPAGTADAAPIVILHDSLGSVEQWRDLPARLALATGRPAIAYDRLGFGRSDPNPDVLPLDFVRNESRCGLIHVREAFAVGRMVLFGHSIGGSMAIAGGAAFAADTEAVVTVAAQTFVEDRTIAGIKKAREAFRAEEQIERLARYHGDKARWVLAAWIETWLAPAFANWCLDEDLRRLRCPVLAIHGDRDEYGSAAHPARIAALAGGPVSEVLMMGRRHMPHREAPDDVLRLIAAFAGGLGAVQS